MDDIVPDTPLRSGWTTGACATAAAKSACQALCGGGFADPVSIMLPRGETPGFPLALAESGQGWARAGVVKDAGDDPDVTHGATIIATVRTAAAGTGIVFRAGPGVGMVTKPGLPIPPGEPAINPVPRRLIAAHLAEICTLFAHPMDLEVEISVPGGDRLAQATWNPRLGIVGGLSILGTTGVVVPYSCSAWIHSIQRGIDVARATGQDHVLAAVGSTSEKAGLALTGLPADCVIDMGDFAGGMLKYLRRHPVPRVTIAGGFAKMCKLAAGHMDLHSKRSQVDMAWLARQVEAVGGAALQDRVLCANTALEVLEICRDQGLALGDRIAFQARAAALAVLDGAPVQVEIVVVDRRGVMVGLT